MLEKSRPEAKSSFSLPFRLTSCKTVLIEITLGGQAASIVGEVRLDKEPVAAAPVYLYPLDIELRRRVHGLGVTSTGPDGRFQFKTLPPGAYLMLSTMELDEFNEQSLRQAGAREVALTAGSSKTLQLDLHVER